MAGADDAGAADLLEAYGKKRVTLRYGGRVLEFAVAQDLFSSHDVDEGTRLLLRSLERIGTRWERTLDVGCGYGPIGVALAATGQAGGVTMVDRDALAVAFARHNCRENGVDAASVAGGLGYDDAGDERFDLVASNIPAKAGEPVIKHLLLDVAAHLRPGGMVAVVVVEPIAGMVAEALRGEPGVDVLHEQHAARYRIYHYGFNDRAQARTTGGFASGVYDYGEAAVELHGEAVSVQTVHGLSEEARPGYTTEFALNALASLPDGERVKRVMLLNPGQGYVAALSVRLFGPDSVTLVDRDLLALRASRRNAVRAGAAAGSIEPVHSPSVPATVDQADLAVAVLREEEGPGPLVRTLDAAVRRIAPGGRLLAVGTSTAVTRLERHARGTPGLRVDGRSRRRGVSGLVLRVT